MEGLGSGGGGVGGCIDMDPVGFWAMEMGSGAIPYRGGASGHLHGV